eukprot:TRINITY_DN19_c0_g1_i1.p1 TRINITY_DN19_c0_g1~~TRINITY_DN19_c0_g1_i1.p1  ORF type:complete len:443 (+),score=160.87 TRINITY_DN19_c0_g1_i1:116-1444(+)
MGARKRIVMRLAVLFLLASVCSIALGVTLKENVDALIKANKGQLRSYVTTMKRGHIGGLIQSFVQAPIDPRDAAALYDAFDMLINSLKNLITEENATFVNVTKVRDDFRFDLEELITSTNKTLNAFNYSLTNNLLPAEKFTEDLISRTETDISTNEQNIKNLQEERVETIEAQEQTRKDFQELIQLIDRAADTVLEILNPKPQPEAPAEGAQPPADGAQPPADGAQPPADGAQPPADGAQPPADGAQPPADAAQQPNATAPAPAFVQLREKLVTLGHLAQEKMTNLHKHSLRAQIAVLLTIGAHGDFNRKEAVEKVVRLLENMRSQLENQALESEKQFEAALAQFNATELSFVQLGETLEKQLINSNDELVRLKDEITVVKKAISENQVLLGLLTTSLAELEDDFAQALELHYAQLRDYDEELELVQQAIEELVLQGIVRPA